MERIEPYIFEGPRAYFTNFDHRIVSRTRNREKLRLDIERTLKILLLTKNTIVCAASHLTSEFTYRLFRENSILLNNGLIIPALRYDKSDISELFAKKKMPKIQKDEMIRFYRNEILKTVNWKLEENAAWFRDSFLRELKNERSVLRKNLTRLTKEQIESIIKEIEKDPLLERSKIDSIVRKLNHNERRVIINFRELIYHMSGARVVNCESTLPQENYIDYSLADIENRQILLSELQIFWKIFLELAFESMFRVSVPVNLIDSLSFEEVCSLRQPIDNSDFKTNYDKLIKKAVDSIGKEDPDRILYDIEELISIREKLSENFKEIFEKELKLLRKRKALESGKSLLKNSISIGLSFIKTFPLISSICNVKSLVSEGREFWFNLKQSFKDIQAVRNHEIYLENKRNTLIKAIQKSEISNKASFIELVNLLTKTYTSKITF